MPEHIRITETNVVLNYIATPQHKSLKKERNGPPLKEILNVKSRKSERAEQNE